MEIGEGERLHAKRRKRFWAMLGWLTLAGFLTGMLTGFMMALGDRADAPLSPALAIAASGAVVLAAAAIVVGSWRFFASVDEVEVVDNLWASLIGFYAYAIIFPAWWLLARLRLLPAPDQWIVFAAVIAIATAAYAWRKWANR
jgi:hypothetical protein